MTALVQSVERALQLLEEVAASTVPPTATELAQRAGVNRATAWRLLRTLEHFNLIEQDSQSGRYSMAYGAIRLSAATNAASLVRLARPVLEQLAAETNGNVFLEVASRNKLIVLDEARPATPVHVELAGLEIPLHCGSVGKLYLASLPSAELEKLLNEPLVRLTPYTVTDRTQLRAQIDECRVSGIALNYREHQEEWCAITSAVRDRSGRDLAYLNVTLPTYRWTLDDLRELSVPLRAGAVEIERLLRPKSSF